MEMFESVRNVFLFRLGEYLANSIMIGLLTQLIKWDSLEFQILM